jgi:hypothetical protein
MNKKIYLNSIESFLRLGIVILISNLYSGVYNFFTNMLITIILSLWLYFPILKLYINDEI